jgi:glycosyltransferase involved in cell wall biosynthesis
MKVVLTTSIARGGPIEQALILAKGLIAQGVEVDAVAGFPEVAQRFAEVGATSSLIPLRRIVDPVQAARIYKLSSGADVVHAHDRRTGLWLRLGPRPRRAGLRVYTAHGIADPYLPPPVGSENPSLRDRLAYPVVDAALCRRADAVVVPSKSVADDLVARLNFPSDRMTVIPNGVEVERYADLGRDGELVGTLSRIDGFKALDVFVAAVELLRQTHRSARFVCYGDGPDEDQLRTLVSERGLDPILELPGHTPAGTALGSLKIYVLCSIWENAPIALLEAMAARVPVVATAVHGIPEIVDESTAQLIPPGDPHALAGAIARLLDDPALAERQASAAYDRVRTRFSSDANAAAMLALYERLLTDRAR